MPYKVETAIIQLETLTPLFIKGKDVNYGEGFLKVEDEVYSIDNDELCQFIYESTYDDLGNKKTTQDYVEWYEKYFSRIDSSENSSKFSEFCNTFNLNYKEKDDRGKETKEFSHFKEKSLQFFLEKVGILNGSIENKKEIARKIAKGITFISDGNKFIQNGNGKHFIPGSSIKGAIRNAVLWKILSEQANKTKFNDFLSCHIPVIDDLISASVKIYEPNYGEARNIINQSNFLKTKSILINGKVDKDRFEKIKKPYKEHLSEIKDVHDNTIDSISYTALIPNKMILQDLDAEQKKYLENFNKRWQNANETLRDFFRIVKVSDANFEGNVNLKKEVAKAVCKDVTKTPPESYQKSFSINLQCVSQKTKARFKISIDLNLAQDFFPSGIPFYLQSVSNLLKIVDEFFRAVADFEETQFYNGLISIPADINPNDRRNAKLKVKTNEVCELYRNRFGLNGDEILFRTGWGGGFMSKTQFLHLTKADRVKIRDLVRHNGSPIAPKSRCLIVNGQDAVTPLGWCKLTILQGGNLPDINQAKVSVSEVEERNPDLQSRSRQNDQEKPVSEKEIAKAKAEAQKIVKQAEKAQKKASYKKGDKIEMKVVRSVPFKSLTLEKDGNTVTVETNKMKQEEESVKVEILEVSEGKITKVKLI